MLPPACCNKSVIACGAGWPSLLQAGCAAQETSARTWNKNGHSTPQNVHSKVSCADAPGLKQAGPPCHSRMYEMHRPSIGCTAFFYFNYIKLYGRMAVGMKSEV